MPILKVPEKKNVWESICKEFELKNNQINTADDEIREFDASKHNSVFYGQAFNIIKLEDEKLLNGFDSALSHPACFGYYVQPHLTKEETVKEKLKADKNKCTEREYLEEFVFPILLPALNSLLNEAKKYRCFERKRTAFNACDFMTEYLYRNNPNKSERNATVFWEIPFVKEWLALYPRKPLPKSLIWTEEEACLKIQAYYRGHLVRRDAEVQELRKWQRDLREENQNIGQRVEKFWNDNTTITNKQVNSELMSSGANFTNPQNLSFSKIN